MDKKESKKYGIIIKQSYNCHQEGKHIQNLQIASPKSQKSSSPSPLLHH